MIFEEMMRDEREAGKREGRLEIKPTQANIKFNENKKRRGILNFFV